LDVGDIEGKAVRRWGLGSHEREVCERKRLVRRKMILKGM
jgi:hypothetical protein